MNKLIKLMFTNGQLVNLYTSEDVLSKLKSNERFIKFSDGKNDVFVSPLDISAFEEVVANSHLIEEVNAETV